MEDATRSNESEECSRSRRITRVSFGEVIRAASNEGLGPRATNQMERVVRRKGKGMGMLQGPSRLSAYGRYRLWRSAR